MARAFRLCADLVAAALLAALLGVTLWQVLARGPVGVAAAWTVELSLTLWLWLVLWGAGVVLSGAGHIGFDAPADPQGLRRSIRVMADVAVAAVLAASLPAVIDYLLFLRARQSATLPLSVGAIYAPWLILALAIVLRAIVRFGHVLRSGTR
jgi:TRAP-type C4-dicarboxylate transport system permease small subunit